jgi:DNA-binding FrmR family transcriptional regulator
VAHHPEAIDILTQISAIQAALEEVALGLLDGHARTCVVGAEGDLARGADGRVDGRDRRRAGNLRRTVEYGFRVGAA